MNKHRERLSRRLQRAIKVRNAIEATELDKWIQAKSVVAIQLSTARQKVSKAEVELAKAQDALEAAKREERWAVNAKDRCSASHRVVLGRIKEYDAKIDELTKALKAIDEQLAITPATPEGAEREQE